MEWFGIALFSRLGPMEGTIATPVENLNAVGITTSWVGRSRREALSQQGPGGPSDVVDSGVKAAIRVIGVTQTSGTSKFITVFPEVK